MVNCLPLADPAGRTWHTGASVENMKLLMKQENFMWRLTEWRRLFRAIIEVSDAGRGSLVVLTLCRSGKHRSVSWSRTKC